MKTKIKELKYQWHKAKLMAADFRGLGASRFKNIEHPIEGQKIFFDSVYKRDGERNELEIEVEELQDYFWKWGDLLHAIKTTNEPILTINFSQNVWNKYRTDCERKALFSFTFYNLKQS